MGYHMNSRMDFTIRVAIGDIVSIISIPLWGLVAIILSIVVLGLLSISSLLLARLDPSGLKLSIV